MDERWRGCCDPETDRKGDYGSGRRLGIDVEKELSACRIKASVA